MVRALAILLALVGPSAASGALPERALGRLGTPHIGAGDLTAVLAYSPDGRLLAAAGGDNAPCFRGLTLAPKGYGWIRLLDPGTGREIRRLNGHGGIIRSLAFSPDGGHLASADDSGTLCFWDVATGRELRRQSFPVRSVRIALAPDGKTLATTWYGVPYAVFLWDAATGKEVRRLLIPEKGSASAVVFSPDGKTVAATCWRTGIHIWDTATGRLLRSQAGMPSGGSGYIVASPDGRTLAATCGKEDIILRDANDLSEQLRISTECGWIQALSLCPDGKTLAVAGTMRAALWDLTTGKEIRTLGAPGRRVFAVAFSPDGAGLAWAEDGIIRVLDLSSGRDRFTPAKHVSPVEAVAYSPDGKRIASAGGRLRLWDANSGKELPLVGNVAHASALAFSPDSKTLLVGSSDQVLRLWDVSTGKELYAFTGEAGQVEVVAFLPDGKTAVSMSRQRIERLGVQRREVQVRLWDVATGKPVPGIGEPSLMMDAVAFSGDGRLLATGMNWIQLWDVLGRRRLAELPGDNACVYALALSPDGRLLAVALYNQWLRQHELSVHETASGQELYRLAAQSRCPVAVSLAFTDRLLAAAGVDGTVRLWDMGSGEELQPLRGHLGAVFSLSFTRDGRRLVSGSQDTTALVWDVSCLAPPPTAAPLEAGALPTLWSDLAADAPKAHRAASRLLGDSAQAIPFLSARLRTHRPPDSKQIARLVADLDDERFAVREQAAAELLKIGRQAGPALGRALEGKPSAEFRFRAEGLLAAFANPWPLPGELRLLRTLAILERFATSDARQVIAELANGPEDSRVTQQAAACLERLARRSR